MSDMDDTISEIGTISEMGDPAAATTGTASLPTHTQAQLLMDNCDTPIYHSLAHQTYLLDNAEEQAHLQDVCRAYRQYAAFALQQFGLSQANRVASLPPHHVDVLPDHLKPTHPSFQQRLKRYRDAAIRNQFCLDCILRHAGQPHSQDKNAAERTGSTAGSPKFATEAQMSKVSSVLKSLARDWSVEGKVERDQCYTPIFAALRQYLPIRHHKYPPRICVPGAGVGRLACELAAKGYTVQGNEFSLYMLLASDFILNGPVVSVKEATTRVHQEQQQQQQQRDHTGKLEEQQQQQRQPLAISPWLLETRNVHSTSDPIRALQVPDVDPFEMVLSPNRNDRTTTNDDAAPTVVQPKTTVSLGGDAVSSSGASPDSDFDGADFSMAAGDFCSIYSVAAEAGAWDCVVACFFLDASPVIIQYLHVIHHMLKPGGCLVNFGPLHWHWSGPAMLLSDASVKDYQERYSYLDKKYLHSVDFVWDDIKQILINIGFELVSVKQEVPAFYTADMRSMLRTEYRCVHFVARKKGGRATAAVPVTTVSR